ncbi:MAG TPA: hypothetical protein VK306_08265 [Acidimicrobiales bacterium]|nr:hypothetical protein [Acidimicrobiales bacterium]
MGRTAIAAAVLAAAAASVGCSSGGDRTVASNSVPPADIPACSDIYTEGQKVTSGDFGQACLAASGDLLTPLPIRIDCEDDRNLLWNDLAWGYLDGPMTLTPEDQATKIPQEELAECLGGDPEAAGRPPTSTTAG